MKNNYKIYKVGGCVRDHLLGVKAKDIDYAFEFSDDFLSKFKTISPDMFYDRMNEILHSEGFEIFLETPSCFTTRARFPQGHEFEGEVADFVMCRKEEYLDANSRVPTVSMGSLLDDLSRRDFTINTIAMDEDGNIIDPFNGIQDIKQRTLRCPIDVTQSFNDDPLRMLRALRFSITKKFFMSHEVERVIKEDLEMWEKFSEVVSSERVREELTKMMKFDSITTMSLLVHFDKTSPISILKRIFRDEMWLMPTTKKIKGK